MSEQTQSTKEGGSTSAFGVTENAAKRIAQLLEKEENAGSKLRVSVEGGGCSGFQYNFGFEKTQNDDDLIIEKDGIEVMVDETSMELLTGSVLDYVETLGAAHFEVKNPQATATCGCGNSFSV